MSPGGLGSFDGQHIAGDIDALDRLIELSGLRRPMLVVDRRAVSAAQLDEQVRDASRWEGGVFEEIRPNPTYELAVQAMAVAKRFDADGLIAVGGGSCIDLAKAVAVGLRRDDGLDGLGRGAWVVQGAMPIIAAPTTAGSGSQATAFGVLYKDGRKWSLEHAELRPRGVVLDVRFIRTLPSRLSAVSAMDALCQCVESIWACRATEASKEYAREGGRLMVASIVQAAIKRDVNACRAIMHGAHLSGCAINISRTTAAHAFSYGLTRRFGLPHGLAVALSLGWVSRWNAGVDASSCTHPAGAQAARIAVLEAAQLLAVEPEAVDEAIASLLAELGLPMSMEAAGVPLEGLRALAEAMDPIRLSNNPRRLEPSDVLREAAQAFPG